MTIVPALTTTHWFPAGPSPIDSGSVGTGLTAGRIEVCAPHPSDPETMLVGAHGGGVWKTTVWTESPPVWFVVTDDQPSIVFHGYHPLVVHPANHELVFGAVCGPGAGVLKSANGGVDWTLLGNDLFEGADLGSLAVHPTNTNVLYVSVWVPGSSAAGGVYRSTDGGLNWKNLTSSFHPGGASDVIVTRWSPHVLLAGLVGLPGKKGESEVGAGTAGGYRSTDGGVTWQILSGSALPSSLCLGGGMRFESATAKGIAYASFLTIDLDDNVVVGRARSKDLGQTWTSLKPTPGTVEARTGHQLIAVDPNDDKHVFANDAYRLFESRDSGQTWKRAEKIGDDWVNVAFTADGAVAVAADRNVYRYEPASGKWRSKEGNQQVTLFYDITLDPTNADVIYGVAQDQLRALKFTGTVRWAYTGDGGGETGKVLVDPKNTKRLYVSVPLKPSALVKRSTNGGSSWQTILQTDAFADRDYEFAYATQRSFAIDPTKPARLLLGTTVVLETTNAAAASPAWAPISGVLSPSGDVADQYVTALAIAPSDGQTVYAATADRHLWGTEDGGGTWKQRDAGMFGMGAGGVVDIRVDPGNPKRVFVATSGSGGIWWTPKIGTTPWAKLSGPLPPHLRAGTVFVDWAYDPPALYAGTSRGVYHSVNMGLGWSPFGFHLPNASVTDLQSFQPLNILAAGTHGRGVWEILAKPSKLTGRVFNDLDGDGLKGRKDPALPRLRVALEFGGTAFRQTTTNASGRYTFDNVPPGRYRVRAIAPGGFALTSRDHGELGLNGSELDDIDFGLRRGPARALG